MQVQSLGLEDPLEEEMVPHSSILAWRIPWTEKLHGSFSNMNYYLENSVIVLLVIMPNSL